MHARERTSSDFDASDKLRSMQRRIDALEDRLARAHASAPSTDASVIGALEQRVRSLESALRRVETLLTPTQHAQLKVQFHVSLRLVFKLLCV